jgi:hypothetical protein
LEVLSSESTNACTQEVDFPMNGGYFDMPDVRVLKQKALLACKRGNDGETERRQTPNHTLPQLQAGP